LARVAYRTFLNNPAHPGLNFKCIHPERPYYSARIGIYHRAIGVMHRDCVIWFFIGDHSDYDKALKSL